MTLQETINRIAHFDQRTNEAIVRRLFDAYTEKYSGSVTPNAALFNDGYVASLEWVLGLRDRD